MPARQKRIESLRRCSLLSSCFLLAIIVSALGGEEIKVKAIQKVDLSGDDILQIEAQEGEGFNFPYYLFIPSRIDKDQEVYVLVESNNTGTTSDDGEVHRASAFRLAEKSYANRMARRLGVPLLVPVFPRPSKDWRIYTHSLDRDSLEVREGKLHRIDEQLVSMFRHAQRLLHCNGFKIHDKCFMHGFSASGSFSNRFAFLHPELIKAVASGGVNGIPTLPVKSWNGYTLPFPIGIGDYERLLGKPFDEKVYRQVPQYIYMGYFDRNDTVPSRDAWSEGEATLIKEAIAAKMMPDRWQVSQRIYQQQKLPVQLVTYNRVAHKITDEMLDNVVEFFRANRGETFVAIKPYEYPFVEYREIQQAHIKSLKWCDGAGSPGGAHKDRNEKTFLIGIGEWHQGQDQRQLTEFVENAGFKFALVATGQKDIELNKKNFRGTRTSGDGQYQEFYVQLDNTQFSDMVPAVSYRLEPRNESSEYYWMVNDGVTLTRSGQGGAFDLLNKHVLPGTISFDGDIQSVIALLEYTMNKIGLSKETKRIQFVLLVKPEDLGQTPKIKFSAEGLRLIEVLWIACSRTSLEYRIEGNIIYIDKKKE